MDNSDIAERDLYFNFPNPPFPVQIKYCFYGIVLHGEMLQLWRSEKKEIFSETYYLRNQVMVRLNEPENLKLAIVCSE